MLADGEFHADAHPANYLVARDAGGPRLVALDFGRVKRFAPEFLRATHAGLRGLAERDRDAVRRAMIAMDLAPDPARVDFDYAFRALAYLHQPWLCAEPFAFTHGFVRRAWDMFTVESRNRFALNWAPDTVLLAQIHAAHALLARLGARVACRDVVLARLYAPGAPRPAPFTRAELATLGV
jgi:hypothetical protein